LIPCLNNLGAVRRHLGKFEEAESHLKRAIELDDKASSSYNPRIALCHLYLDMGREEEVVLLLEEIKQAMKTSQAARHQSFVLLFRGELHRRAGQYVQGRLALSQALELVYHTGRFAMAREIQDTLAELLSDSGQHRSALVCFDSPVGDQHDWLPQDLSRRELVRCKVHARLGEHEQACHHGVQARDLYADMSNPLRHGRSLAALADAHAGLGDLEAARECREEALTIFTRLGVPEAKQMRALLEAV
ncbi:MAG: tetratricopeptide repeat protein, partial [Stackebrandtia sp.]